MQFQTCLHSHCRQNTTQAFKVKRNSCVVPFLLATKRYSKSMGNGQESNIGKFRASMTPEQMAEWQKKIVEKGNATRAKKRETVLAAKEKAKSLLPELIAADLLLAEGENYTPRQSTIDKIKSILKDNPKLTMEDMRKRYFSAMSDRGWEKLTKALFKSHLSHVEDLGLEILQVKKDAIRVLEKRIRMLNKEIKNARKYQKANNLQIRAPSSVLEFLVDCEKELLKIKLDVSKAIHSVGAVGEKNKTSGAIHIHTTIPRPTEQAAVRDITPTKVSLDELISNVD